MNIKEKTENILILKGDRGKSKVIDILMDKTNSICFVYDNHPGHLKFNAIDVDSREHSPKEFLKCISDTLKKAVDNNEHYDYLLVYTNQNEENLQEIIYWLKKYSQNTSCENIILTCK